MLQEKKKKLPVRCIRFGIFLLVLIILIFLNLFFFLFILLFFFTKKKGNKETIDFEKLLEFIGVQECLKYIFNNDKVDTFRKEKKEKYIEKKNNTEILRERPRIEEKVKIKKSISTEGFNPLKNKYSSFKNKNKTSFNNGKSIWDDYESVIDIMNKKR